MRFSDLRAEDCFINFRDIFIHGNNPVPVYKKLTDANEESNALSPEGTGVLVYPEEQVVKLTF